jgi:hypothetical protein
MDHLHYRLNFDLDKSFITAWSFQAVMKILSIMQMVHSHTDTFPGDGNEVYEGDVIILNNYTINQNFKTEK